MIRFFSMLLGKGEPRELRDARAENRTERRALDVKMERAGEAGVTARLSRAALDRITTLAD